MRKFQKRLAVSLVSCIVFAVGALVGNLYHEFDFLCGSPSPYILSADMVSESGIMFPKGTIVPVKYCANRARFDWEFAMDIGAELEASEVVSEEEYGFSLLEKVE